MDASLINERTREKTITVHQKLESIKIPKSSESNIIIPCNPSGYGFVLLDSNKEIIKDIPTQKINKTIRNFNKCIDTLLIRKKMEESRDYNSFNIMLIKSIALIGVITAFVMYILALYDVENFKEKYIFIPLSIIFVLVVVSLFIMVRGLMTHRIFFDVDAEISKALDSEIDKENNNYYVQRGYAIEKGTKFCWISIKKIG